MLLLSNDKRESYICYEFLNGVISVNIDSLELDEQKIHRLIKALICPIENESKIKKLICCIHGTLKNSVYGPNYVNSLQSLTEKDRATLAYLN